MKKTLSILMCAVLMLALFAGCGSGTSSEAPAPEAVSPSAAEPAEQPSEQPSEAPAPEAEPVELYISAAASLTDVLTEIGNAYMAENKHVTLTFTFDSSGTLQTQIEEGAPADLFLSAAQKQMNTLEEKSLIDPATRLDLLVNKVVLIVPAESAIELASFEDVATDKVAMVAVGDDTVPVGQYTEEIYTALGSWEQVKAKANLGANVRAVLAWVETGDVDCGVVYATDAASTELVKVVAEAPEGSHQPVIYPGAVLAGSEHADAAKAFLGYLKSDTAVKAFETAGFTMA